jgi:2-dehydropantoate 2-reductase
MRITVFGIGAMGCLFGARLSQQAEVTLVGHWPDQIRALQIGRLRLVHPDRKDELVAIRAVSRAEEAGPADIALILTKSSGTARAAESAAQVLSPDGLAITLQNGLGNLEIIAGQVGEDRAALGVTTMGAAITGPGVIRLGGSGPTYLACRPPLEQRVRDFADLLTRCGFEVQCVDDVSSLVWGKLAVNAAINPLAAILRVTNGTLAQVEWTLAIMQAAAREVEAVAAAQGIRLPFDAAAEAEAVAGRTALNRASMLQDVLRGVETEIEAICGAVMRAGEEVGISTPANTLLYRMVKAVEVTYIDRIA